MLARAIASQSHANFLPVSMPDLVKAEVGASEKALAGVFRLARECRPCILFLDEVDAVFGGEQGAGRENGSDAVLAKLTAQLLLEMDAIHDPVFASPTGRVASMEEELQSGGILIVAATNVPGALRAAVLRSGRLDRQVYVPPPDMDARRSILRSYMQRMALSAEFTASDDHAVTFLAEQTHNYSGADLRNLCNQAGLGALRRYHMATAGQHLSADESQTLLATQAVTFEDFKLALDTTRPSLYPALLHKYEMWRVHGGMSALATK